MTCTSSTATAPETEIEPYGSEDWARIDVNMQDGAAVIRMVQQ